MKRPDGLLPDRVRLGLLVSDVGELFHVVADDLREADLVSNAAGAARALAEREAVQSTALGAGIAIPHARAACCEAPRMVAARLGMAIDFAAPDRIPVDLVFVILSPTEDPAAHVKHIAQLARLLSRPGVVEALRLAPDEESFRRVLAGEAAAA